jgi:hypothetical protein
LADPVQIVRDVLNGPEPDRTDAADRLIDALTGRHLAAWQDALSDELP